MDRSVRTAGRLGSELVEREDLGAEGSDGGSGSGLDLP